MAYNILVVDDSQTVRDVVAKTLKLAEVDVGELHMAGDGQKALDILNDNWIDLVFSDLSMPVMNGMEMIEKMRKDGLLKTVPVVIVSTEGSRTRIKELMDKGVRAYVRKPFTPESMLEAVNEVMGERKDAN